MSDKSSIGWTDATWNPVRGCTKISAGCKFCYAERFAERWRGIPGHAFEQGFDLRLVPEALALPLRWKRPRRIFVNSVSDLFHKDVPDEYIAAVFGVMAAAHWHTFQVLTKRADRLPQWFAQHVYNSEKRRRGPAEACMEAAYDQHHIMMDKDRYPSWPLPNVHVGVSVENQAAADERIPYLLKTPAAVRFLSCEPLIGPVELTELPAKYKDDEYGEERRPLLRLDALRGGYWVNYADKRSNKWEGQGQYGPPTSRIGWVIVGGESGPGARMCPIEWVSKIVGDCKAADVPVFVKQLGAVPMMRRDSLEGRRAGDHPERDWPLGTVFTGRKEDMGTPWQAHLVKLKDRKGENMAEWPESLRIREFPRV